MIEPQFHEAQRTAWNKDVRIFQFYHPPDPRPPMVRSLDQCLEVLRERKLTGRVGVELSQARRSAIAWSGEPSVYTLGYFDAFRTSPKKSSTLPRSSPRFARSRLRRKSSA